MILREILGGRVCLYNTKNTKILNKNFTEKNYFL